MLKNIGKTDRTLRILAGLGVLSLAFYGPQSAWGYLGVLPLVTGLSGYCPLYELAGVSTNRAHRSA